MSRLPFVCHQSFLLLFPHFLALVNYNMMWVPQTLVRNASLTVDFFLLSFQLCPATHVEILGSYSMATSRGPHLTSGTKSATAVAQAMYWKVTQPYPVLPLQQVLLPGIFPFPTAEVSRRQNWKLSGWQIFKNVKMALATSMGQGYKNECLKPKRPRSALFRIDSGPSVVWNCKPWPILNGEVSDPNPCQNYWKAEILSHAELKYVPPSLVTKTQFVSYLMLH